MLASLRFGVTTLTPGRDRSPRVPRSGVAAQPGPIHPADGLGGAKASALGWRLPPGLLALGPGRAALRLESGIPMASHRKPRLWARMLSRCRRQPIDPRRRTVELVDAGSLMAHLLTPDALDAGRRPTGRYVALCGVDVLPASLTAPPQGHCRSCISIPSQRTSSSTGVEWLSGRLP